jgi:hypothetical protein
MAPESVNLALVIAAALSATAALLHVGCIVFGASWYRVFGAGERMATMAERGEWRPTLVTGVIVLVLSAWAAYALSGAGVLPRFPLLRTALCLIAGVYTLRGVVGLVVAASGRMPNRRFWWWSSLVCLVFGLTHAVGLAQRWPQL